MDFLFGHKRFSPIFWTQFLGAFNDNVFKNALVVYVAFKEIKVFGLESAALVALASGLFILPYFLFSSISGQLSDRFEKATLIKYIKWWEVVLMVVAAGAFYLHAYEVLIVLVFFMGTQSTFFGPIKYSILYELVDDSEIVKANAYIEMGTFVSILLGMVFGVAAVSVTDNLLVIGSMVVVIAILGVVAGYLVPKTPPANPGLAIDKNLFRSSMEVIGISKKNMNVYRSIIAISWFWFFGALVITVIPTFVKEDLFGDQFLVTLFLAFFTIGIGIGSIACEKIAKGQVNIKLVPIGGIGMGLFVIALGLFPLESMTELKASAFLMDPLGALFLICLFAMSFSAGIFTVPLYTYMQVGSTMEERSRVIASNNIINAFYMVVCSVLIMISADILSYQQMFIILGVLNLLFVGLIKIKFHNVGGAY